MAGALGTRVLLAVLAALAVGVSRTAAQTAARARADTTPAWREQLSFLSGGSGVWITSNAQYRTEQNQEPHSYGMWYRMGFGGTVQHGCLWGASPGRDPAVFWHFFTAWDPVRRALLVHQSGSTGVVGLGYESAETGIAEQTFTAPDGTTWDVRHVNEHVAPDTLVTRSFQRPTGDWEPRRTYTWVRQPPGTAAPCA